MRTGTPETWGLLAEFGSESELASAAEKVRDAGYTRTDAFMPYPSHDVIHALGVKRSKVPLIVLIAGACGAIGGFGMQYWISAIDYPLNVGGRPLNSWVSFIVVTFELTILLGSVFGVLGMFALNKLPQPYHPVFNAEPFRARASRDGFFLAIESEDDRFDPEGTMALLRDAGAMRVMEVEP
jgi:Alternative complex III, ActD subunit